MNRLLRVYMKIETFIIFVYLNSTHNLYHLMWYVLDQQALLLYISHLDRVVVSGEFVTIKGFIHRYQDNY